MNWLPLSIALIISAVAILTLRAIDPKRRRHLKLPPQIYGKAVRAVLAVVIAIPGIALAVCADPASTLLWMGAAPLFGCLAVYLGPERPHLRSGRKSGLPNRERHKSVDETR